MSSSFSMLRPRVLAAGLGVAALLATAAILALEVAIAQALWPLALQIRVAAVVASAWQATMLIILAVFLAKAMGPVKDYGSRKPNGAWFALGVVASVLASAACVVMLVLMGKEEDLPETLFRLPPVNFLIGSAIALVSAFVGQLTFIVVYFVVHRLSDSEHTLSLHTNDDSARTPPIRVKSVPYSRTTPATSQIKMQQRMSMDYSSRPGSSGSRSVAETMSSIRTSISHVVRPSGSRTRLLSSSSKPGRRPPSTGSGGYRERSSLAEDGFDSWDTSSVDPQNRQTVLDTTNLTIRSRFLETIPASPTTSRSPSPGCPLDLEPPKRSRRSRSYSPVPRAQQERSMTTLVQPGELHIHPLFRSDSPAPPAATPGTIVVAAPNAGQTISEKSLTRMRSGSLPTGPVSLSRQGSYDSFRKTPSPNTERIRSEDLAAERQMTPPIPEWILSSGSKTSLADYQTKGQREPGTAE
ncbi:hypothetical protein GGS23DRAFT_458359 [Durotheca rogersii]|uniref:uncharacterized protein n=1 Tax=Durotheca rogersii TaxID=419775 RepID=UPI002220D78F|nr:uncharacterized protein GGS23DRAFT_458359 [Durotheca rogersii]KAI5864660.1 hypothetical protein GGS23DRAFT_458359 [Durotheca rogersii]